jgi:hypothetical protein
MRLDHCLSTARQRRSHPPASRGRERHTGRRCAQRRAILSISCGKRAMQPTQSLHLPGGGSDMPARSLPVRPQSLCAPSLSCATSPPLLTGINCINPKPHRSKESAAPNSLHTHSVKQTGRKIRAWIGPGCSSWDVRIQEASLAGVLEFRKYPNTSGYSGNILLCWELEWELFEP